MDGTEDGIYLTMAPLRPNDFIWDITTAEEYTQEGVINHQLDGTAITPENLTPLSSPSAWQDCPLDLSLSDESQEWDHSPERLVEDEAILWETDFLTPLSAKEIGAKENSETEDNPTPQEEVMLSPLGTFKRHTAVRRRRVPKPVTTEEVQTNQAANLDTLLSVRRPLLAELVDTDRTQMLDRALSEIQSGNAPE